MLNGTRAWLPPFFWAVLLFIASSMPNFDVSAVGFGLSDKFWHVIAYLPLGFFLLRAVRENPGLLAHSPLLSAFLIGVAYGVLDEFHQSFVPGRFADAADLLADAGGLYIGILVQRVFKKRTSPALDRTP